MILVDCHCHLMHELYKDKLDQVIERARKAGVKKIITSGVNTPTNREALALSEKYDIVECSFGLYPTDLLGMGPDESGLTRGGKLDIDEEFKFIKKNKDKILAIGEVGMDFKMAEQKEQQKKNFERIIEHVEKLKKPIVIHSRKAEPECLDALESSKLKKVQLHCFTPRKSVVKRAIDLGYSFSIPAIITKLQHFQMVAEMAPLPQLLTETDAPWLTPDPRGNPNEPSFVKESVKWIAKMKGMDPEETSKIIYQNYQRMFE